MKKRFTKLIALCFLSVICGGGLQAQHGVLRPGVRPQRIDIRRANSPGTTSKIGLWYHPTTQTWNTTTGPSNVNNEFGAGESAWISGGGLVFPVLNPTLANPPQLRLGSVDSKNIVINTYNAGGYASGWLDIEVFVTDCGANSWNNSPVNAVIQASGRLKRPKNTTNISGRDMSKVTANLAEYEDVATGSTVRLSNGYFDTGGQAGLKMASISSQGGSLAALDGVLGYGTIENEGSVTLYMAQHGQTASNNAGVYSYNKAMYQTPYTTTGRYEGNTPAPNNFETLKDDGVFLFQYAGDKLISSTGINVGSAPEPTGATAYKRPTTVALTGDNAFQTITFNTLDWYFQKHEILPFNDPMQPWHGLYYKTVDESHKHTWDCCHYRGRGDLAPGEPSILIKVTQIPPFTVYNPQIGPTKLDAAVQILNGARVCVNDNVDDATGNIGDKASVDGTYLKTNALIVLPKADRFTLRTKGNFKANMAHEPDSAMNVAAYYAAAQFPDPDDDVYLYKGAANQTFGQPLRSFTHPDWTTVTTTAPYLATTSSIFGVYGDYQFQGEMAKVHTDSTTFDNHNKGIIEVGPTTDGKTAFHVYGNGMLKNYEGCNVNANFAMEFGQRHGGTPRLKINTDDSLYIVNFGNNATTGYCAADLLFHTTSVDSVKYAFTGNGAGALHVQALSDVRLRGDGAWDMTTKGNNVYLLSDGGNISTQKLDLKSDNIGGVGHGLVTFFAETDQKTDPCVTNDGTTRFSESGNILFNDVVTLKRATAATTQTNIIAANNVRTAAFSSTNANDKDTTNIISRKGDIYLGYSAGSQVYDPTDAPVGNNRTGNDNVFAYNATGQSGTLNIKSGYDDQANTTQYGGGNIYFTHINAATAMGSEHDVNITIPFSNEYYCGNASWSPGLLHERIAKGTMQLYEHAGIIGGVGRCGVDGGWSDYAGKLENPGTASALAVTDTSLVYKANKGTLLVDAGTRGNIIMNRGTFLDFQNEAGEAFFLTRHGDIDLRYPTDVQKLTKGVVFLASNEDPKKLEVGPCGCDEQRNNIYMQDFRFDINGGEGSVFFGADNNIKLQYGGLKDIGTQRDPFLSENKGYPCGGKFHCDADTAENQARDLILDFNLASTPGKGGVGVVASDLIDVYRNLIYNGGTTPGGMSAVPKYNTLQGESVAGYGLYIKTQANKKNWNITDFELNNTANRDVGAACEKDFCDGAAFLHRTARVTFHADARLYAENQKVLIASPVLDTYGNLELNTHLKKGGNTSILIQTDSLICHDSLIIDGPKTQLKTWTSGMERDIPIIKLGHQRFTPPAAEGAPCPDCFTHKKDPRSKAAAANKKLDSIFVTFRNDAQLPRLHALVADHAVISFLTDSFDHTNGNPTLNAKFFTDIFKVRNHVELFTAPDHLRDGHFELCSEEQMATKDYAGVYTRHLHMEPIAPTCSDFRFSQFWFPDPMLNVIPTSTFGGFGWIHADVHVEIGANLFPGFASLGKKGNCYEQRAGVLKMQDLRLDKGANFKVTVGEADAGRSFAETYNCPATGEKIELGRYADCIVVDSLSVYGTQFIDFDIRSAISLEAGQSKCYPIIQYNKVGKENLNNLKVRKLELTEKDHPSIEGKYYVTLDIDTVCKVVYLCIATLPNPVIHRPVNIPAVSGVSTSPVPGTWHVVSGQSFTFKAKYSTAYPLKVTTNRFVNGAPEEIIGTQKANGEFEYVIPHILQTIQLQIGPDPATTTNDADNVTTDKAVWSNNNRLHIRVDADDIATIYSVAGQLVKQLDVPAGTTTLPLEPGVYVVTLKDGTVHKIIVK